MPVKKNTSPKMKAFTLDEQTFHRMFNEHSAIMLLIDPHTGEILDANQSAINFYGYPQKKFFGMSICEINVLPADQVKMELQRALNGEENIFVFTHRMSGGEDRIVELHSSPITLQEKRVLFSIIHDITERRQAEEALKESELHYRAVAQSANEAIISSDSAGNIIGWNKGAETIFGYSESEAVGFPLTLVMPSDLAAMYWAGLVRMSEGGEKRIIGKTVEMKGRRKSGDEFPLEISLADWQGKNGLCYTAIIRDITVRKEVESELRKSEERYRSLFNSMMDGIYSSTHEGRFVDVNPAMVKMFGYSSREEMLTLDIEKELYFAPEERGSHILDTGQEEIEVYRMRRKDGAEIWVEDHGHYVHDEQGNILYHEGMLRDITTRKRVEDALRESEQNYRTLANSGQALIWASGTDAQCNYFNEIWLNFTGRALEQELGNGWTERVHPEDFQDCMETYLSSFERRVPFSMEFRLLRRDGEYRWLLDDGSPQYNTAREFIGYIGHCLDITERKQAAEIIRESEERLAAVVEGSQLGYSDWNIQTGEIRRNERWAGMLGYTLKEIESTYVQWEDLLHPDDRISALQAMKKHLDGETPFHRDEYRLRAKDGSYRWILDQGKVIEYDLQGNPARMTATHTDVTARKKAEEELFKAKDALEITHQKLEEAFLREQQLARIDILTGVNNRRYLFELAAYEFNVSARYDLPLSVLMFDVDEFKLINDNFGHAIGDQVLQRLAQVVLAELRSADVIGRYGGDEFVILLPQTGSGEARVLGERIHARIASMSMKTSRGMISLTISLGIAQMLHHTAQPDSLEEMLQRADQALYSAKQAGRNRTVIFNAER